MDSNDKGTREHREESGPPGGMRLASRGPIRGSNLLVTAIAVVGLTLLTWRAEQQQPGGEPLDAAPSFSSLEWWRYPVERNRFLRPDPKNLTTEQYNLHSIALTLNGENGWAVGQNGTMLRTTDGGRSWSLQPWPPSGAKDAGAGEQKQSWLQIISPAFAFDGRAPVDGRLQIAQQQPSPSAAPSTGGQQTDVQQRPPASGQTPVQQEPPGSRQTPVQQAPSGSAQFPAGQVISSKLIATPAAVVMKAGIDESYTVVLSGGTKPYGMTFQGSVPKAGLTIRAPAPFDNALVITGTRELTGGAKFTLLIMDASNPQQGLEIPITIITNAVAAQGGAKDSKAPSGTGQTGVQKGSSGASAPAAEQPQINMRGSNPTPQQQQSAPPRSAPQPSGPPPDLNDVHFLADGRQGWIVGNGGTILHTQDGGAQWEIQHANSPFDLHAVAFDVKGERGWAVGNRGIILVTENGGTKWDVPPSMTSATLRAVIVYENKTGWAVGDEGVILQTEDGGRNWKRHEPTIKSALYSLSLAASGKRALAVGKDGKDGIIVTTTDGGKTWQPDEFRANHTLRAVLFNASGQRGWIVGDNGTVVTTIDGGVKWEQRSLDPKTHLRSVAFADDARRGLVVGHRFMILTTRDGGLTWNRATHRQYPAPWFYVASVLLLGWTVRRYYFNYSHEEKKGVIESIADNAQSDEPIDRVEQDRLGFTALVKGLAAYLRNRATVPPLTIAISAPWGGGKSSVMRMLRTEMRSVGVRSVWFNSWHHQKEEVMLAALLESIRTQALPFWATREGVVFRSRLLWRRICAHPFFAAIGICALVLAGSNLFGELFKWMERKPSDKRGWVEYAAETISGIWDSPDAGPVADKHLFDKLLDGKLTEFVGGVVSTVFGTPETLLYSFEIAVLAAAILVVFLYGIRSFPGSPAVLLASVASQFKIAQVQAQTGYRQRFKMHFSDVCESLRPRTMLIFIDDLDRCEPAKTAEMLEAINYLVNSGTCFVVIGMARDIVEAQLAIHFDRVADAHEVAELGEDKSNVSAQKAPASGAQDADRTRINYVRNYLRKLINLEVHIPQLTQDKVFSLLELTPEAVPAAEAASVRGRWRERAETLESTLRRQSPLAAVCGILIFAVMIVMLVQPGISQWDQTRIEKIRSGRKAADERLNSIREAERRAAVALDFARGQEKKIASELFNKYRVAVAGLEFRLPVDPPRAAKNDRAERCAFAESASLPKPSSVKLEDSDELYCWRHSAGASRAVEEQLNQIKASLESALAARSHDSFDRVARELTKAQKAAESAEQLSGVMRALPASSAVTASSAPGSPRTGTSASEDAVDTVRKTEHDAVTYWLLYIVLAWAALRAMTRRESYLLKDQPYFLDALRIWSPLLGTQPMFAVPREVKRFQNRARFYAMRLRNPATRPGWLSRIGLRLDGSKDEKPDAKTFIPEEVIVALTAIHQVCPELLTSRASPIFDGNPPTIHSDLDLVFQVREHIAQHDELAAKTRSNDKPFAMFPIHRREVLAFLAIIEEFEPEPEPAPTLRAAA